MLPDWPCVYTIPAGAPFLDTLATALIEGNLPKPGGPKPSPVDLSKATVMLPSRRTSRAVQDAFLRVAGGAALLLPRIEAIGDGSEDETWLAAAAGLMPQSADAPPAIGEVTRRLTLTTLIEAWSRSMRAGEGPLDPVAAAGAATPAQAVRLAGELARLMDLAETEGVDLARLKTLVPADFSEHWGQTLAFLDILLEAWPAWLDANQVVSPMARRTLLLRARAAHLRAHPPPGPVIVAGVTGTIPAQAEVIRAVAALPHGAIVLPALDLDVDEAMAAAIRASPDHPQSALARMLETLGLRAADVRVLGAPHVTAARTLRARLVSEAFRPAAETDQWHAFVAKTDGDGARAALRGLSMIDAPSAAEEAEVVALILREALETPTRTAALVTPDRLLARRVATRLAVWGIAVDDSAGRPFAKTPPGAFLDLLLEMLQSEFAPVPTIALLKHPLTRLNWPARDVRRAARILELAAFRAPYLGRGVDGLAAALERAERDAVGDSDLPSPRPRAVRRLSQADWALARDLVDRLRTATAPWSLLEDTSVALQTLARVHADVAQAIAAAPQSDEPMASRSALFEGEAGEAAHRAFIALVDPDMQAPSIAPRAYPDVWRALLAEETVRPRQAAHPRLAIWGPFEARLQQPDVVVLGSMNEGTWPAAAEPGPWLNRPMRATLGLSAPEAAIGRAVHDVATLLCAEQVIVTRARKVDGNPTVPSRWIMRLRALLTGIGVGDAVEPDRPWLAWAQNRNSVLGAPPPTPPAPVPSLERRPRRLSVTEIERWMANPYAIYAKHILKLEALPPLGMAPGAALKGAILHDALGRFTRKHPATLPDDAEAELVGEIERVLRDHAAHPRVAAFWRPRLARFARWFVETEPERRRDVTAIVAETSGLHLFEAPAGRFTLTARADRIDRTSAGLRIIDYKTGTPPTAKAVVSGRAPQLPLEALIAASGGFADVPKADPAALTYIRARGGEPPGEEHALKIDDLPAVIATAYEGLLSLIERFDNPTTPYAALRRAAFEGAYRFDEYAHLARVKAWSAED